MKEMNLSEKDVSGGGGGSKDSSGITVKKATKINSDEDGGLGLGSAFQDFGTYNGKTIG
jgi:hypothetical protein